MSGDTTLSKLAERVGVFPEYTDMQGTVHEVSADTQRALLRGNGVSVSSDAEIAEALAALEAEDAAAFVAQDVIVQSDIPNQVALSRAGDWVVLGDHTGDVLAQGSGTDHIDLPALPSGVHDLCIKDMQSEQTASLIVAPQATPSLYDITGQHAAWGVVASLYGLAQDGTQGLGSFDDLAVLAAGVGSHGAGFLGINPVHALGWGDPGTTSPYSPTHRGFLNTSHITPATPLLGVQSATAELLDYPAHVSAQRRALEEEFERFQANASADDRGQFDAFVTRGGPPLQEFAQFEALSEVNGPDWRSWPESAKLSNIAPPRVQFHLWMQWRADAQLGDAQTAARDGGMSLGLYLDLAVGARLGGAESWGKSSAGAVGVSLGAPPDQLSPAGQNWQLTALAPRKLQQGRYTAFRQILAQTLRHCGLLRIDHALGLNRSYWIPEDGSPGGYIKQPFQALMAVIAIEAQRAKALIVGEDLGLVPFGFRDRMAQGGLYGYTVLQYEKDEAGRFLSNERLRPQSLACFGTHDTPTLRGFWQGCDIDWWRKLEWIDDDQAAQARTTRQNENRQLLDLADGAEIPSEAPASLAAHVHGKLAKAPAALVAVQLDDILNVTEAQNLPGTVDTHPNWRRRSPKLIPEIISSKALVETAGIMTAHGRASRTQNTRKDTK